MKLLCCIAALAASLYACKAQEAVAAVLILEAGGEGQRGMQAVLNVIDNRARATHASRVTVIAKPKQFSCLNNRSLTSAIRLAKKHPQWDAAVRLVSARSVPDITGGALFYHEKRISPNWASSKRLTVAVGGHLFYSAAKKGKV